jgi:hypothetical protein
MLKSQDLRMKCPEYLSVSSLVEVYHQFTKFLTSRFADSVSLVRSSSVSCGIGQSLFYATVAL